MLSKILNGKTTIYCQQQNKFSPTTFTKLSIKYLFFIKKFLDTALRENIVLLQRLAVTESIFMEL